ncbi:hypothetical protein [Ruminiclostridium josui]|uniref:hypothetical protein n=1 Tax=Ruminiclostridium josui TaxID=1499 RepID=UPI0013316355|nr:hypothetical protein [Ruminiclostridium josui]
MAYKEKAAQERKAAEANWQKAEDAKKAQYSIKSTDIQGKMVSAEKSRIFIEEALKGIKVNSDMSVTVTIPDILPEGWVWRIRVGCTEKDGSWGTLITTSDIVVGQTITVKPYTAASNIKEYTVKIEFDNGISTAFKGGVGSGMYISKDLIKGGKYVYVYGKGFTERPSYNP